MRDQHPHDIELEQWPQGGHEPLLVPDGVGRRLLPDPQHAVDADDGVAERERPLGRIEQRHLVAPRLADGEGGRAMTGRTIRCDDLQRRGAVDEPLGDRRVAPELGGQPVPVAADELLGAARVVGDGDGDVEPPRRGGQLVERAEHGDAVLGIGGEEGIDQRQALVVDQREAGHLVAPLDGGAPLRVRRRPAIDAGDDLVHARLAWPGF